MDKLLGDVRLALQESGVWEETLLILVADHHDPSAPSDVRVPLIIKLPGNGPHIDFESPWTHVQFLPLLDELFRSRSFDSDTVLAVVQELRPTE